MYDIMDTSSIQVALLAGGKSSEREISLASAEGARGALTEAGFKVEQIDPAEPEGLHRLMDGGFDVAFICVHGRGGEDGALQGFLETIGMPYTGSGVFASAVCMEKTAAKLVYESVGVPTPPATVVRKSEGFTIGQVLEDIEAKANRTVCIADRIETGQREDEYEREGTSAATKKEGQEEAVDSLRDRRYVVKAASEGSSVGVYIEEGADAVADAIQRAFEFDDTVLVERYIKGIEMTVVVLGDEEPHALPIIEIVPKNASYDFEAKYAPGGSEHICPARISDAATSEIKALAERAHKALGCSGVSRTDFLLDADGQPWALETNTIPGMTATSLLPDAARAAGISFADLCTGFIKDALERGAAN